MCPIARVRFMRYWVWSCIFILWSWKVVSVCRPHPDKMTYWAINFRALFMDADMRILVRTTEISRSLFNLFHFYPDTDMRIRILIRKRGIAALTLWQLTSILFITCYSLGIMVYTEWFLFKMRMTCIFCVYPGVLFQ